LSEFFISEIITLFGMGGCVNTKYNRPMGSLSTVQPYGTPPDMAAGSMFYQQSVITGTSPMMNGLNTTNPPYNFQSNMMKNSRVMVQPIPVPSTYQPQALNNSGVVASLEIARDPYARQVNMGMGMTGPNVGRQPLLKLNGQSVEVTAQLRDAARNMNFTPVQINPMGGPTYDINSNYAMEATQVGGIKTFYDPKIMDLDMDPSTS
jgi:hypothetical protein